MELKIYDGAEGIGGSKIYLREKNNGVFLDFGLNFNVMGMYFKEFISMRAIRGLNDPIEMGLLPKIQIYRDDLKPSDLDMGDFEKIPVDAVLLTHAHVDHYGLIGYLDFSIPVVASPETIAIIKAYQDASKSDTGTSIIYSPLRIEESYSSSLPILKSTGNSIKTKMEKISKYLKLRTIIPTETLKETEKEFLFIQSTAEREEYLRTNLEIGNMKDLPFKVRAYPVDHSIYGSVGYVIELESSKITYTGDLRFHGERGGKSKEFAERARGTEILIVEGTRLADDREHNYTTENDVFDNCMNAVAEERNLIIADFSARNFERLNMFSKIAKENGRSLVITDKDAYAILGLLSAGTKIDTENILIYDKPSEKNEKWKNRLREGSIWVDKHVGPSDIRDEPENYILAFSLYDMPNMMDIKPDGGLYLYSSTEAFNEEMELDFVTLNNWLRKYHLRSVGFRFDGDKLIFEKGYHASGHASPEELENMISIIDPDIIVPVHTTNPKWFTKKFGHKTKIIKNGESLIF